MKMEQTECSETYKWHIKLRRRAITQKKAHDIQNMAKVWNPESVFVIAVCLSWTHCETDKEKYPLKNKINL